MFKKALDIFSHSDKGPNAIAASADCLYNLGLCYMEEGNIQMVFCIFRSIVICDFRNCDCLHSVLFLKATYRVSD